jgi:hypothetical protein
VDTLRPVFALSERTPEPVPLGDVLAGHAAVARLAQVGIDFSRLGRGGSKLGRAVAAQEACQAVAAG